MDDFKRESEKYPKYVEYYSKGYINEKEFDNWKNRESKKFMKDNLNDTILAFEKNMGKQGIKVLYII